MQRLSESKTRYLAGCDARCRHPSKLAKILTLFFGVLVLGGCSDLVRNPVPMGKMSAAFIPDMKGIRAVGLEHSPAFQKDVIQSVYDDTDSSYCLQPDGTRSYCVLAISGGGGFGAFGAGFVYGWTKSGTRPNFKLVTGISTGALIGSFAFLGPEYDEQLKEAYTTVSDDKIFRFRGLLGMLSDESFNDSRPLARMLETYVNEEFLAKTAAAHRSGRRFYVGTTNMDRQRFVVWNMGAIAASGKPGALALFRKILLASSSIPTVFPPVYIQVDIAGEKHDEMHSDGGVISQVFFHANVVDLKAAGDELKKAAKKGTYFGPTSPGHIYVIRNAKLDPEEEQVKRSLKGITKRALSTLTKTMALSDLQRIYLKTQYVGQDFNYVDIPEDFEWQAKEEFDQGEMNRLFEIGYQMALTGGAWDKTPPGTVPGAGLTRNLPPAIKIMPVKP